MTRADDRQTWGGDTLPRARLRPPSVQALPRERLLDTLVGGTHRLALVTGPAGSGKTTLLTQFVHLHANQDGPEAVRPVVWYQLDDGDGRAPVLLRHLAQALGMVVTGLDGDWESVEHAVVALEEATADEVLLALDDLHVLAGTAAEEALGQLLDLAPPWLRVAATCRQPPRWNLSRLRVSGALVEVGADDLRFRSWEVERLFTELYREPLPPGDLAQLNRGLEGWAAGLQMFHLATRGKPITDRRRAVAALPARSKLIREYLTGNVLDELPEELRTFLIDTSAFGRLSPALGDELRGRKDSARLLHELEARQVFVVRVDEDGTYRYHEVFRTYLEGRLVERDGQSAARAWSHRAAELLETEGHMLEALRAYCRAEDWRSVERVLEKAGPELVEDSVSWLDWLPQGLIEGDPWAMLAAARRASATGRFARALDLYAQAEQMPGAASVAEICRRERAGIAGWVDPAAPQPAGWGGRLLAALRSRPDELTAPTPGLDAEGPHAGLALVAGAAAVLAGDIRTAVRWLTPAADDPAAEVTVVAGARVALAVARALGGDHAATTAAAATDWVITLDGATGRSHPALRWPPSTPAPTPVPSLDDLDELFDVADAPWLGWLARAVRGVDGSDEGWRQALAVAGMFDRHGDAWGGAAARFFAVLGSVVAGGTPVDELDDLRARLQALDVAVVECWCLAWRATALARRATTVSTRLPAAAMGRVRSAIPVLPAVSTNAFSGAGADLGMAEAAAAEAESMAASVGVPGAQVWAVTVQAQLAAATDDTESAAAHLARAAALRQRWNVDVDVPALVVPPAPAKAGDGAADRRSTGAAIPRGFSTGLRSGSGVRPRSGPGRGRGSLGQDAAEPAVAAGVAPEVTGRPANGAQPVPSAGNGSQPLPLAVPLRLRTLGGLSLEIDGRLVDLRSAKPRVRAALRLLAANAGRPVHVETLLEALWPAGDPAASKRSLQVALSSLRRLFDDHSPGAGALIARDGEAYLLALPEGADADVVELARARDACRAAARRGDAEAVVTAGERAVNLYGGELLPEEGPSEWVVQPRRHLAQDASEIALLVADHAINLGRWETAVSACSRGLDIDRYSDGLWRLLAVAHERRGDPAAAAQAQERYRLVLEDLGMAAS